MAKKQHILASLRKAEQNIFVPSGLATGVFEELPYILKRIVGDSIPVVTMLHGYPAVYFPPNIPRGIKTATEASDIVQVLRPEFVDVLLDILPSATVEVIPNCVPQFPISANRSSNTMRASEILCPWDNRSPPNGCIQ